MEMFNAIRKSLIARATAATLGVNMVMMPLAAHAEGGSEAPLSRIGSVFTDMGSGLQKFWGDAWGDAMYNVTHIFSHDTAPAAGAPPLPKDWTKPVSHADIVATDLPAPTGAESPAKPAAEAPGRPVRTASLTKILPDSSPGRAPQIPVTNELLKKANLEQARALKELNEKLADAEAKLAVYQAELQKTQSDNADLNAEIQELTEQMGELTHEVDELQQTVLAEQNENQVRIAKDAQRTMWEILGGAALFVLGGALGGAIGWGINRKRRNAPRRGIRPLNPGDPRPEPTLYPEPANEPSARVALSPAEQLAAGRVVMHSATDAGPDVTLKAITEIKFIKAAANADGNNMGYESKDIVKELRLSHKSRPESYVAIRPDRVEFMPGASDAELDMGAQYMARLKRIDGLGEAIAAGLDSVQLDRLYALIQYHDELTAVVNGVAAENAAARAAAQEAAQTAAAGEPRDGEIFPPMRQANTAATTEAPVVTIDQDEPVQEELPFKDAAKDAAAQPVSVAAPADVMSGVAETVAAAPEPVLVSETPAPVAAEVAADAKPEAAVLQNAVAQELYDRLEAMFAKCQEEIAGYKKAIEGYETVLEQHRKEAAGYKEEVASLRTDIQRLTKMVDAKLKGDKPEDDGPGSGAKAAVPETKAPVAEETATAPAVSTPATPAAPAAETKQAETAEAMMGELVALIESKSAPKLLAPKAAARKMFAAKPAPSPSSDEKIIAEMGRNIAAMRSGQDAPAKAETAPKQDGKIVSFPAKTPSYLFFKDAAMLPEASNIDASLFQIELSGGNTRGLSWEPVAGGKSGYQFYTQSGDAGSRVDLFSRTTRGYEIRDPANKSAMALMIQVAAAEHEGMMFASGDKDFRALTVETAQELLDEGQLCGKDRQPRKEAYIERRLTKTNISQRPASGAPVNLPQAAEAPQFK